MRRLALLALLIAAPAWAQIGGGGPPGVPVPPYAPSGTPTNGQCLVWSSAANAYVNSTCGSGSGITALTGVVTGTGPGSATTSFGSSATASLPAGNLPSGVLSNAGNALVDVSANQALSNKDVSSATNNFGTISTTGANINVTAPLRINPGTITWSGSGGGASGDYGLWDYAAWNGTCSANCLANAMQIQTWNVNNTSGVAGFGLYLNANMGTSEVGGYVNLQNVVTINATTANGAVNHNYQTLANYAQANVNDGGSSPTYYGNLFSVGNYCLLQNGATFWKSCTGTENDLTIATGASGNYLLGYSAVLSSSNAVAAAIAETGYEVAAQAGATATWTTAYAFGDPQGNSGLASTAVLMRDLPNGLSGAGPSIGCGIDLNGICGGYGAFTFATAAYTSPGFLVDPTGGVTTTNATPSSWLVQSGAGANLGWWQTGVASQVFSIAAVKDDKSTPNNILVATRSGSGSALSNITIGNSVNAPTYTFAGGGAITSGGGGAFTTSGNISGGGLIPTGSSTAGNRIALPSTNTIGIYANGTQAATFSATAVTLPALASSSAATTGTVCWTTGGNLTVDTTLACLASLGSWKQNIEPLQDGLAELRQLRPISYELRPQYDPEHLGRQIGFEAEDVEKADYRLVGYGGDGQLRGVRYMQLTALLASAAQEQDDIVRGLEVRIGKQQLEIYALALWALLLTIGLGYVILRKRQ